MKSFKFFLSLITLFCFSSTQIFAQPKITTSNNPNGGDGNPGCEILIDVVFELTNLNAYPPAILNGVEFFPSNLPNMALDITIAGSLVASITDFSFTYIGNYMGSSISVYESKTQIEANLCDFCLEGYTHSLDIPIVATLIDKDNSALSLNYPACTFAGVQEIFSCGYFIPAGSCDPDNAHPCNETSLTSDSFLYVLDCSQVNERSINGGLLEASIYPNPASDLLTVSWENNTDQILSIELVDTNGLVLNKYSNSALLNKDALVINTNDLVPGLYFVRVNSRGSTVIKKVIKN